VPQLPETPSPHSLKQLIDAFLTAPSTTHGLGRALRTLAKELDFYRNHSASQRAYPSGRIDEEPTKVQIGGGSHRIDGFYNIDVVPPADLLWDVREEIPLHDSTVDMLFSEHFLEHIDYPKSAKHYVRETHRVLAPGGQVITGVPDAAFVLSKYPAKATEAAEMIERWYSKRDCHDAINTYLDLINYVFRDQDDDPTYNPHYWAYDYEKLVSLFGEAGFETVGPWTFDPALATPKRQWASVYVVAVK
jgi:predicted SAM-dependent methyltransferase